MSNYVPPTAPMGGPTGQPQGFPPQQGFPPPPQKKSNVLMWVLVGCGSFIVIGVIAFALIGYFVWNKAKEAGLDPELMKNHPAAAVGKMVVAANPDVELVGSDDAKGTITVRDKKTGKVVTINLEQAKNGKISFKGNDDGEEVSIEANGSGDTGTIDVKSKDAHATFGTGTSVQLPDWLPSYPGATIQGNATATSKEGVGGSFSFSTTDSIDTVMKFYEDKLKSAGLKVTTNSVQASGNYVSGTVTGEDGDRRKAFVTATSNEGKTQVVVVYGSK